MALVVGENTYASLVDIQAWNTARGYTATINEAAVLRAMDYIESLNWVNPDDVGVTVSETATLYWGDNPPQSVINALCMAARMEHETSGVLMPKTQKRVKSEAVDVIRIEYEGGGSRQDFPAISRLLRGFVYSGSVIKVRLA